MFGEYGRMAATPSRETRNGILVDHPRYFLPPRVGMNIAPDMIARAVIPAVRRLLCEGFDFDLIDAHYYYPDGVAAAIVARVFGKPFIVTARGSDLNLIAEFPLPRRRILDTATAASASVGVSKALTDRLAALGAASAQLHVLRNGVDLTRFAPVPRADARNRLGLQQQVKILLFVGNLVELKGHHVAIQALPRLPADVQLLFVGAGPERARLGSLAREQGVVTRVRFVGAVPQDELKWYYSAADALVLCSSREGWANVLLEAMACGTPVIATAIAGTIEVVTKPEAGLLMRERSSAALAESFASLFSAYPASAATRRYAERFSWDATTAGQLRLMRAIVEAWPASACPSRVCAAS